MTGEVSHSRLETLRARLGSVPHRQLRTVSLSHLMRDLLCSSRIALTALESPAAVYRMRARATRRWNDLA
jgi:hypothetical protein